MPLSPPQGNRHPQLKIRSKFCGICRLQDAVIAAEQGAAMVGIMQVKRSKRYLPLQQAAELCRQIRASAVGELVDLVAVVANPERDELSKIISELQPDMLQFHGSEDEKFCASFNIKYIKAIKATNSSEIRQEAKKYPSAAYLLLDSAGGSGEFGGSGEVFDWTQIPAELSDRLIIAGGLNPDNIGALLAQITPAGVDVSSGIESQPGIKDAAKMRSFAAAVARQQV